jgi:hypothetical protein
MEVFKRIQEEERQQFNKVKPSSRAAAAFVVEFGDRVEEIGTGDRGAGVPVNQGGCGSATIR